MSALRHSWAKPALGAMVAVAVSAAWTPLRDRLPGTDLALLLVLVLGAIGWLAGTIPAVTAAIAAALSFDLLDTRPYGTLTMSRASDVLTAAALLVTGALVGGGAARLSRYRGVQDRRDDALAVVMEASSLVATGGEEELVSQAVESELTRMLRLRDCERRDGMPTGTRPTVARDGSLVGLLGPGAGREIDLPVWSHGDIAGYFRLRLGTSTPGQAELRMALGIADQAGAAMTRPAAGAGAPTGGSGVPGGGAGTQVDPDPGGTDGPARLRLLPAPATTPSPSPTAPPPPPD